MKKELLLIVFAVMIISSCRKENNELPGPLQSNQANTEATNNANGSHTTARSSSPFTGSMEYAFSTDYDLPCDCGTNYVVGNFLGTGELSHLGNSISKIKPCISPIYTSRVHTGDHVAVECALFIAANGDELDCYTHPYDLTYGPLAETGTVTVDFVGGTGRFANATGSFTGTVSVPYGTGTASLTGVTGTINY